MTPLGVPVEPDVYCRKASVSPCTSGCCQSFSRPALELVGGFPRELLQAWAFRENVLHPLEHVLRGQRDFGLGVVANGLNAGQRTIPPRRIGRHGHDAGIHAAEEGGNEIEPGRIKQQCPLPFQLPALQPGADRPSLGDRARA